ncbi:MULTISPECIES: L-piperidine-6-carboxylate dehydrogenase [Xanthomonas]|uniref:aldehyde dehydrogenase (NAD(+)) n=1 Tax=Xanthomonas cucurbitae TaxID=56453 RepID=A0A2S7DSA3_9XANT|nr:aldehyde dehydrogenase family protein [Xanthomonas cucurbitae]PPU76708.1 aldehyde dehydrogenase family protein [Xanthomonas cucurbitae]WDM66054.1 aldehyde dehydrogenase family protein [Xanthomonas cucurbitae]WDM69933.1 aldehyde dehydrogenase family protein [Xanthomonas cucurbitae]WDM73853.1 aldehyde dehydrogenase family protein [Xanthomonas cucurbitae]WDM80688.1 aldehyde dehydrogenase family protein [Xanthomonas cucurbitae]
MSADLLKALDLAASNSGTYLGKATWSQATGVGVLQPLNPTTNAVIADVQATTPDDYELIIQRAQAAFKVWRTTPAPRRGEAVRLCGEALRAHKDALGSLVALEMGKSKPEGDGEVQEMIDIADFAVGQSRMLYGYTMHSERPGHRMYEQYQPLGLVGIISAFNFPVAVWAWNAFLAAICGDICIWKPSNKTPLTAIATMKICNAALKDAGFPDIFFLVNDAGTALSEKLVQDKRIPLISFTGSTQIGRVVAEKVAHRLGRCLLELGGNNAIILDETADLKLAIPGIVFGAVGTAGQRCTTTRRLIVHDSLYDTVLATLVKAYKQLDGKIGDPTDPANLMGPLNSRGAVEQFLASIAKAKASGGTLEIGGTAIEGPGNFVLPAIVTGLQNSDEVVQHETFAPILYVMKYATLDEAIELQNGVPQGLSSSIFTQNLKAAEKFLSAAGSDCGIANVNIGTSGAEIGGAFGGEKETGGGRESGSDAWKVYMRRQTNTINYSDSLPLAQGIKFDL